MSQSIISVDHVGKRYQIGASCNSSYRTLRESVVDTLMYPFRQLKNGAAIGSVEDFWAIEDVSFEIKPGEVVGIVGRNGAGKSTLLKMLSGITPPSRGRIALQGRVASLLEVGTGFHPELTGRENIYLNGSILGMNRREIANRFDEIVDYSGVEHFLETPVKRYSSGMKVRLAFAVAAFLEPEILIIDEVLAVGDVSFQRKCLGRMDEVARSGRTVLFVSHNMGAVKSLCSRGIVLDKGRVAVDSIIEEAVDYYMRSSVDAVSDGDFSASIHHKGTGEARIRSAELSNRDGQTATALLLGQPFGVKFSFEVFEEISSAHLEVRFRTMDGTIALCAQTADRDAPLEMLSPGKYEVTVWPDTVLLPHEFAIDLFVHRETGETIDSVEGVLSFSVDRVGYRDTPSYRWERVRGFTQPEAVWSIQTVSQLSGQPNNSSLLPSQFPARWVS
jgi:lipopolysaccharide transport system ATP-binding protein